MACVAYKQLQIGTDMRLIITSIVDELFRANNINDLK